MYFHIQETAKEKCKSENSKKSLKPNGREIYEHLGATQELAGEEWLIYTHSYLLFQRLESPASIPEYILPPYSLDVMPFLRFITKREKVISVFHFLLFSPL